jgi:hypothetical protein
MLNISVQQSRPSQRPPGRASHERETGGKVKVEARKRMLNSHDFSYELLLTAETPVESLAIDDVFGSTVGEDGLISLAQGSVKLSDGYGEHYIILRRTGQPSKGSNPKDSLTEYLLNPYGRTGQP